MSNLTGKTLTVWLIRFLIWSSLSTIVDSEALELKHEGWSYWEITFIGLSSFIFSSFCLVKNNLHKSNHLCRHTHSKHKFSNLLKFNCHTAQSGWFMYLQSVLSVQPAARRPAVSLAVTFNCNFRHDNINWRGEKSILD